MKSIKDMSVSGKRVLCRVDFNVPLDADGNITDDSRIRAVLPTLRYVLEQNAKLIIASHLGRPEGEKIAKFSLAPAAVRLYELLGKEVRMAPDCVGPAVSALVAEMRPADILLLENLRYHAGEQKNDDEFAKALAALCDIFVNDAFAVSHRVNASVAAITKFAPVSVAGLLLANELDYFKRAMDNPRRPLAAVIGGAKVSSKLAALENMLHHVDKILIGGAMANTFLKFIGCSVGRSKVEDDRIDVAGDIMKKALEKGIKFFLPVDVVVADRFEPKAVTKIVSVQEIPSDWMALDIGPATVLLYAQVLQDAKTIIWNGPMGVFEIDAFSRGTMAMASVLGNAHALTMVGGGDTDAAIHQAGEAGRIGFISTGGGAFLALMEGKPLPAIAALDAAD